MGVKFWLTGAAAAIIIGTAGMSAEAAPAPTGLKATASEASAVEKAHGYRRYHRRYYRHYAIPYVYLGNPYWHRRHWRDYGYFYRPYYRRYWR